MKEKVCNLREINSFVFCTDSFGIAPGGRSVLSLEVGDEVEVIDKNYPEWWKVSSSTFAFF